MQHLETAAPKSPVPTKWASEASDHDLYNMLADVAAQRRDVTAVRAYAPRAEDLARRYNHTLYLAIAHRAWGVAHRLKGDFDLSQSRLEQARDLFVSLETRWQLGRTLFELGETAAARGRAANARDYFWKALAEFQAMQAEPDAARTRAALTTLEAGG